MALPNNTGAFIHKGVNCTPNTIQTAQGVPYSNSSSGLSATNVQGAIDEVYTCCIPLVYGTQTASTGNWVGELNVSALYDGLTINYYLPYDSDGNVSLNLTLADGSTTGSKPVYFRIDKRLSTQFSAGATITITYYSAGSISRSGTATNIDMWICQAESVQVQQMALPSAPDAPYPVLFGVGLSLGNIIGPTVKDLYNLYYNPSTTTLTATKFSGDISGCTGLSGASVSYSASTTVNDEISKLEYNNSSGGIDMGSYTDANPYIPTTDGYVMMSSETSNSGVIRCAIRFANGTQGPYIYMNVHGQYQINSVFVKKGMRIGVVANTTSAGFVKFYPLDS